MQAFYEIRVTGGLNSQILDAIATVVRERILLCWQPRPFRGS
jgi:hypothetical protein